MKMKRFEDIKVGDPCNDADCKFPAGTVRSVEAERFTVEWERCTVRYNKDHPRTDIDDGHLIVW